jgi:hypothetical protein
MNQSNTKNTRSIEETILFDDLPVDEDERDIFALLSGDSCSDDDDDILSQKDKRSTLQFVSVDQMLKEDVRSRFRLGDPKRNELYTMYDFDDPQRLSDSSKKVDRSLSSHNQKSERLNPEPSKEKVFLGSPKTMGQQQQQEQRSNQPKYQQRPREDNNRYDSPPTRGRLDGSSGRGSNRFPLRDSNGRIYRGNYQSNNSHKLRQQQQYRPNTIFPEESPPIFRNKGRGHLYQPGSNPNKRNDDRRPPSYPQKQYRNEDYRNSSQHHDSRQFHERGPSYSHTGVPPPPRGRNSEKFILH